MTGGLSTLLDRCLGKNSPSKELLVASLGCLLGSILVLLALQTWADSKLLLAQENGSANFVTLNKTVKGGILLNLSQQDKVFQESEIQEIAQLPGVLEVGGFSRNHFPVTVHIWPAGKIGLGAAARADLFFESVPVSFLDQKADSWEWEEGSPIVPIMVPKFYLDLWNFGLAPSRSEYPALSQEAASAMPIEIFIGADQSVRMQGRFVAFSKRINSVLVPSRFLKWANSKFAGEGAEKYFFVWKDGEISGPPVALSDLKKGNPLPDGQWEFSPVGQPAECIPLAQVLEDGLESAGPSRLLVKLDQSPSEEFWEGLQKLGCETNREFPQDEWIRKAVQLLVWGLAGLGSLVSLLSIATFSSSFRLLVVQSAETARNLIHLGFGTKEISRVFMARLTRRFLLILGTSLCCCLGIRTLLISMVRDYGLSLDYGLDWETLIGAILYAWIFLAVNRSVIMKSVRSFA